MIADILIIMLVISYAGFVILRLNGKRGSICHGSCQGCSGCSSEHIDELIRNARAK